MWCVGNMRAGKEKGIKYCVEEERSSVYLNMVGKEKEIKSTVFIRKRESNLGLGKGKRKKIGNCLRGKWKVDNLERKGKEANRELRKECCEVGVKRKRKKNWELLTSKWRLDNLKGRKGKEENGMLNRKERVHNFEGKRKVKKNSVFRGTKSVVR